MAYRTEDIIKALEVSHGMIYIAGAAIRENAGRVYFDRNSGELVAPASAGRDYGAWDDTINSIARALGGVPVRRH